jgi:iron complex outermembrane receptor protein
VLALSATAEHSSETLGIDFESHSAVASRRSEGTLALSAKLFPDARVSPLLMLRGQCAGTRGNHLQLSQTVHDSRSECTLLPPDARVGLRISPAFGLSVLANAARVTLIPSLGQLYGISPSVVGNPELVPETSTNFDLGGEFAHEFSPDFAFSLGLFGFFRSAENLIRYQRTSLEAVGPFNEAEARLRGLEGELRAKLFHYLKSRTAVTVLDARRLSRGPKTNSVLPLTPRLTLYQELSTEIPLSLPPLSSLRLALNFSRIGSRYVDSAGFVVLPSQSRVDATTTISLKDPSIHLRISAQNLTNSESQDLLGYPLPGRSFHASVEAWWK